MGKGGFSRAPLPWWPTGGRHSGGAVHGSQPARKGQWGRKGAPLTGGARGEEKVRQQFNFENQN